MFPACKKGRKLLMQDTDSVSCDDDSIYRNPRKNVLAALDERICQLERGGRARKKRKPQPSLNTCSSQRPNSVPSKTVSFSPHSLSRGDIDLGCDRKDPTWRKTCPCCDMRGPRSAVCTSPRRKKLSMCQSDHCPKADCAGSTNEYGSPEYYTDVCGSPGPAGPVGDRFQSSADYNRSWNLSATRTRSEERPPGSVSTYYSSGLGRKYPYIHPNRTVARHVLGCMYTPTSKRDPPSGFGATVGNYRARDRTFTSDMNVDLLLAKYSKFSHTRTLSAPTNYIPYKSSFLGTGKPLGNVSNCLLPSSLLTSTAQRAQSNPFTVTPVRSRFAEGILHPLVRLDPFNHDFNKSLNCSNDYSAYKPPVATRTFVKDPMPYKTRTHLYPTVSALPRSMSEHMTETSCDARMQPWLLSTSSSSRLAVTPPRASTNFSSQAVRSADSAYKSAFQSQFADYDKTPTPGETSSGNSRSVHVSRAPFLGDLSKYCSKGASLSTNYSQFTREGTSDFLSSKPQSCISFSEVPKYSVNEFGKNFGNFTCPRPSTGSDLQQSY